MPKPGNSKQQANGTSARFQVGEGVICYHQKGNYIARVLKEVGGSVSEVGRHAYLVHYLGWNKKHDEIVNEDQLDKLASNTGSFYGKKKRVPQQLGSRKQQSRKPVTLSTPSPPAAAAEKQSRGLRWSLLRKHLAYKGFQRPVNHQKSPAASSSRHTIRQRQKKTSSILVKGISDGTVAKPFARRVSYSYLISLIRPIQIPVDVATEKLACSVIVTAKLPPPLMRILLGDHCRIMTKNQCFRIPGLYTVDVCLNDYVLSLAGQNEKIVKNVGDFVEKLRTKFNAKCCEFLYAEEETQYEQIKRNVINCSFVYPAVALLRLLNIFETCTVASQIEQLVALEMRAQLLKFFKYLMERSATIFDTVYDERASPSGTS